MSMGLAMAVMLAQAPTAAAQDVAYDALAAGNNRAAVARLERTHDDDPARLINLGVALARQGDTARARAIFARAAAAEDRVDLETATGAWIDSRTLALRAIAAIDRGRLAGETRTAMR